MSVQEHLQMSADKEERTTQQTKIIRKRRISMLPNRLANRSAQEQNQHHRSRNPKRSIQIRIPLQHIQEVRPGIQRRPTTRQNSRGINVKELRVERDGPEETLGAVVVV